MRSKTTAGAIAGIGGGIVFGILMTLMSNPEGTPMMVMVAMILGSQSLAVGWLYHLFNSAVIGAIFGALLGDRARSYSPALGWGALYGFGWWILGGLVLMPVFLGMTPFSPLVTEGMRGMALGSLMGHLIYGLVLGGLFVPVYAPPVTAAPEEGAPARPRPTELLRR